MRTLAGGHQAPSIWTSQFDVGGYDKTEDDEDDDSSPERPVHDAFYMTDPEVFALGSQA